MWNEEKSRRFDDLRREEARQELSEADRAELDALFAELDAEEAQAFEPVLDRLAREADELRTKKERVGAWARKLESIIAKREKLLAEARPDRAGQNG